MKFHLDDPEAEYRLDTIEIERHESGFGYLRIHVVGMQREQCTGNFTIALMDLQSIVARMATKIGRNAKPI